MNKIISSFKFFVDKNGSALLFFSLLFILCYALGIKYNTLDYDLWSRLLQGQYVAEMHSVMYNDVFSYTDRHTWYDPEWLSSTFLYLILNKGGLVLFSFMKSFLFFLVMVFSVVAINQINGKDSFKYNIEYIVLFLSLCVSLYIMTGFRCQNFTFVFLPIWIFLLEKIRNGHDRFIYLLPVVMLLWLNIHGACMLGSVVLLIYALGEFLNKKSFIKYLYAFLLVFIVHFINPWGSDYIGFLFESIFIDRSWIDEWITTFGVYFRQYWFFDTYFMFTFFAYIFYNIKNKIGYKNLDKVKLLLLLSIGYKTLFHMKYTPLFIIISMVFCYKDFLYFINFIYSVLKINATRFGKFLLCFKKYTLIIAIISYSVFVFTNFSIKDSFKNATIKDYPVSAVEFLRINNITGNIYAPYYFSSFIAYKCYPNLRIFVDGRQEQVYNYKVFTDHSKFLYDYNVAPDNLTFSYPIDVFLYEKGWEWLKYIEHHPEYKKIFEDDKFMIFHRIDHLRQSYKMPSNNDYLDDILFTDIKFNFDNID